MVVDPAHPGASRLNHLGLLYAGAIAELGRGHPVALLPSEAPGLSVVRDLLQLVLFQRAEVNALTAIILDKGLLSKEDLAQRMEDEYELLARGKAEDLGRRLGVDVKITDQGLSLGRRTP